MNLLELLAIVEDDKQVTVASPYGDKIFYDGKKNMLRLFANLI